MTDAAGSFSPAPMEGRGAYNRSSRVQAAGLSPAVPLLEQAAAAVDLPGAGDAIVIADYGSSEGRNSLVPIAAALRVLRTRAGPERAIAVVHTDLPGNDFNALFQTLANDPDSYLRSDPAVFASAVGRSFYRQILPPQSVTLGWSSWAVQWLSRAPAPIPDQVQVAYSRDAAARAAYTQQAAEDWSAFLAARSHELRAGGRLVVLTMALLDDGDFGYRGVLTAMYAALMSLVGEGFIDAAEAYRMAIPTVGRSRADLVAPFSPSGRFADLSVERVEVFFGDDRIWREFERDADASAFGMRWAAFSRASVFPTLALGLNGGPGDPRAGAFMDKLEAAMAARLAANPEPMSIPLASAVLVRASRDHAAP
jgi:SAM dependent carboxyl methyltransferase